MGFLGLGITSLYSELLACYLADNMGSVRFPECMNEKYVICEQVFTPQCERSSERRSCTLTLPYGCTTFMSGAMPGNRTNRNHT